MAYEIRENTGTIFRNDKRDKETQPNARGTALIDGVNYEISSWTKEGKNGKFQSLSFKRKDDRPAQDARPAKDDRNSYGDSHTDEIPF
jgi:hypothetical protein